VHEHQLSHTKPTKNVLKFLMGRICQEKQKKSTPPSGVVINTYPYQVFSAGLANDARRRTQLPFLSQRPGRTVPICRERLATPVRAVFSAVASR
jgi:hypothetical protein